MRRDRRAKGKRELPSRACLPSWLHLPVPVVRFAWVIAVAALAACDGANPNTVSTGAPTGQLFARGIDEITDLYIEPVSGQKLVLAGARSLSKLDDRLTATLDHDRLILNYAGREIGVYNVPATISGHDGGEIVAQLITVARLNSTPLAAMQEDAIDRAVFDGMTGTLDRFSRYAPPEEARDARAARDGFGGIGVSLETNSDDFRITAVSPQGPAEHAGLRVTDRIVAIDGAPTAGHRALEIIHMLRGPIASPVVITVRREGETNPRDFWVQRELVVVPTVTASRDGNIAIFRIASFNQSTTQLLTEGLLNAQRQVGGQLGGIVLDLRGNPGGLLDQAVSLADLFILKGPIIATVGRHPASHQYFPASGRGIAPNTPLVVLINGGSASASEIVAAALQDAGRAVVIGTSSYGKGTVQTVMRLPNDGELTLTWARLVTPSGYYLQEHGVVPTLCTSGLGDDEQSLELALRQTTTVAPGALSASRPRASLDERAWSMLRRACPALPGSPALDIKVAERVLADPTRYGQAVGAIRPAASPPPQGAALTPRNPALSSRARTP
jgi:carboxyl-terminal processing protease